MFIGRYKGMWEEDVQHGHVTVCDAYGNKCTATNSQLKEFFYLSKSPPLRYEGAFNYGWMEGHATVTYANGSKCTPTNSQFDELF